MRKTCGCSADHWPILATARRRWGRRTCRPGRCDGGTGRRPARASVSGVRGRARPHPKSPVGGAAWSCLAGVRRGWGPLVAFVRDDAPPRRMPIRAGATRTPPCGTNRAAGAEAATRRGQGPVPGRNAQRTAKGHKHPPALAGPEGTARRSAAAASGARANPTRLSRPAHTRGPCGRALLGSGSAECRRHRVDTRPCSAAPGSRPRRREPDAGAPDRQHRWRDAHHEARARARACPERAQDAQPAQ
jgi:hypothetical protein